MIETAYNTR